MWVKRSYDRALQCDNPHQAQRVVLASSRSGGALCRPCLSHGVGGISNPWRERPRRRARGVAPRLSGRVVHATACLSVSERCGVMIGDEYAPPADQALRPDHGRILQVDQVPVTTGFCAVSRTRCARPSGQARLGPAVTFVRIELCSAPCKALRFAPTPLAHPNAAAALGPQCAGPADLDGVCAQLVNSALT